MLQCGDLKAVFFDESFTFSKKKIKICLYIFGVFLGKSIFRHKTNEVDFFLLYLCFSQSY